MASNRRLEPVSEGEEEFDEYEDGAELQGGIGAIGGGGGGDESNVFAIGTVVFPVEKDMDLCDPESVLVNPSDSYIGKYVGQFLSERLIGGSQLENEGEEEEDADGFDEIEDEEGGSTSGARSRRKHWRVLGTMQNPRAPPGQFLWATMHNDDFDAYLKEVLKCGHVIYDMTQDQSPERLNEVRMICDALRARVETFMTKRVFILISSLHSWSHSMLGHPHEPNFVFSEANYRYRRTQPLYRELQLLERYVVASGKMTHGMLKAYVIGAGAVYGSEQDPLHSWFKAAWHNSIYLPIYGDGKNYMPLIYIKDLASIIQHVLDLTPKKQRYIIAVDPVIPQQEQVVKAIADALGTEKVRRVPEEDIHLNKAITTFQADQLMLNLRIETTFCKENFDIDWFAEDGFPSVVAKLVAEYRKSRNLNPFKILIMGPPGSGKTTIARQLSDMYRLHHFTKEEMIESTKLMLRDIAGEELERNIAGIDVQAEEEERTHAKHLLDEIFVRMDQPDGNLSEDTIIKIFRYRLLTNPCQNQGFILDGYPENFYQAKALFGAEEQFEGEDAGEDDDEKDQLDPRLAPDRVFILEAPDWFLKKRITSVPVHELAEKHQDKEFQAALAAYNVKTQNYDTSVQAYLDEQEIIYYPIDITTDQSPLSQSTVQYMAGVMGKPRNYGITREEEEALRNAQTAEKEGLETKEKEDLALLEGRELEERRKNIQKWMEKLARVKKEEFEREEAALLPLRHYLMQHVVPTLTRGLMDVTRVRPEDPVDFLAEYLFQNNPAGLGADEQYLNKQ